MILSSKKEIFASIPFINPEVLDECLKSIVIILHMGVLFLEKVRNTTSTAIYYS